MSKWNEIEVPIEGDGNVVCVGTQKPQTDGEVRLQISDGEDLCTWYLSKAEARALAKALSKAVSP